MCQSDKRDVGQLAIDVQRLVRQRLEEIMPMDEAMEIALDVSYYLTDRVESKEGGAV